MGRAAEDKGDSTWDPHCQGCTCSHAPRPSYHPMLPASPQGRPLSPAALGLPRPWGPHAPSTAAAAWASTPAAVAGTGNALRPHVAHSTHGTFLRSAAAEEPISAEHQLRTLPLASRTSFWGAIFRCVTSGTAVSGPFPAARLFLGVFFCFVSPVRVSHFLFGNVLVPPTGGAGSLHEVTQAKCLT